MRVSRLIEVLHQRFQQPSVDFEFLESLREVQNFINVSDLCHSVRNKLVFLIKPLNLLETVPNVLLVNLLVGTLGSQTLLKRLLDGRVTHLYLFLHVFGDGLAEGGELHI